MRYQPPPKKIPPTTPPPAEIDLLPQLWRSPNRTLPGNTPTTAILELDALSGGAYCLVVDTYNSPKILTFYKRK